MSFGKCSLHLLQFNLWLFGKENRKLLKRFWFAAFCANDWNICLSASVLKDLSFGVLDLFGLKLDLVFNYSRLGKYMWGRQQFKLDAIKLEIQIEIGC